MASQLGRRLCLWEAQRFDKQLFFKKGLFSPGGISSRELRIASREILSPGTDSSSRIEINKIAP
jgi:hypothetical protein